VNNPVNLIEIYKNMSELDRQDEIDAIFEIMFAMLEACECDSMESFPNTNIKLSFKCEVLKDGNNNFVC
jgi:hypothetical protein